MYTNDIDMRNIGVEFTFSADVIRTADVRWNISLNGMHYRNELTRLPASKDPVNFPDGYKAGNYWRKLGGSLYDWYTYEYAGVDPDNGLPLYNAYTKDPETGEEKVTTVNRTSDASLRQTGLSAIPDFNGGLSTTLEFFGFDLSASTAFQIGGYVMDDSYRDLMGTGNGGETFHKDIFERWTPTHRQSDVPQVQYGDQEANSSSDRFLTAADYFSLRNVTAGYSIPARVLRKAGIARLRVYLTGDNLLLLSRRAGLDPRQHFDVTTGYGYSAIRTCSLGLSLGF